MISKNIYPYLNDMEFLNKLDTQHIKTYFARIYALGWDQEQIDIIQGKVISANINIDGNSSMRRTASLNIIADGIVNDLSRVDNLISINKKMKIEIGFTNTTKQYPEFQILYFPLGIYVISSAAISHALDSVNITLQFKDKMCLLNGENGGIYPASTQLHKMQTIDEKGQIIISYPTISQIIVEAVHHIGGEDLSKIIVSDLDQVVKQVVYWMGDVPVYIQDANQATEEDLYFQFDPPPEGTTKSITKHQKGQAVGFILTDFTYPGDLIADAGATVTSILDNIIGVLGNYEYFYDVDGNFRFQEKKNFLNISQASYILEKLNELKANPTTFSIFDPMEAYILDYFTTKKAQYVFNGGELISSFNNNPQYQSIKNDYVVWGVKKVGEQEKAIRYHLAIDNIPEIGNTYTCIKIYNPQTQEYEFYTPIILASNANRPDIGQQGIYYYIQDTNQIQVWKANDKGELGYQVIDTQVLHITTKDWRTELYFQGLEAEKLGLAPNYYYAELKAEWPAIYDIQNGCIKDEYVQHPEKLTYYLDIIGTQTRLGQFSIANIGRRTDVQNLGTDANCVFEPSIPNVLYIESLAEGASASSQAEIRRARETAIAMGLNFQQVPTSTYSNFSTSEPSLNSCYQEIRQKIQQFTSYNESISFVTIPIYYLEPNIRITVNDPDTNIYGDYLINSMSFTLDASSTMTINATRILQKI